MLYWKQKEVNDMRYFKCKVELAQMIERQTETGDAAKEQLAAKSVSYVNEGRNGFVGCVISVYHKDCTFVFAGNGDDRTMQEEIAAFWEYIGFEGGITETNEICGEQIRRELRMGNVDLPVDLDEQFQLPDFRHLDADEHIVHTDPSVTLSDYASAHHFPELAAEAERIRAVSGTQTFLGHPVHYIVEENNKDKAVEMIDLLVDTLYHANRLQSARVIFIDEDTFAHKPLKYTLSCLYQNFTGGTLVVSVKAQGSSGEYADAADDLIEKVCGFAVRYRHEVLTVFHIPQHNTDAHRAISAYLNNELTVLTFAEAAGDFEQSAAYMRMICEKKGIADAAPFIEKMDPEQNEFYIAEIETIFNDYYTAHLKKTHFPAYLSCENTAVKETKIEGKAADTLAEMIGLTKVKQIIGEAVSYYQLQKIYQERQIPVNTPAQSMIFTGNPGTAKTTVARLTAKIFKDNGLLESGKIVEVGRGDLVGRFVGWTAPTVKAAFKRAKGSILFIDEAYSLVDDRDGSFGDEAINTIVQEMENHREDTIVIFAGYPDKMERFLNKNPGLRSRIAFHVDFPDYTPDELLEILRLMAKNHSMKLDAAAEKAALAIFRNAVKQPDFGNGRFARNLLEKAQMRLALRLTEQGIANLTEAQLTTLCAEDFEMPAMCAETPERRVIGF